METLDKHFRALTQAAFAKHGFASADLLSHWPEIVGAENAAQCVPERITWPRATDGRAAAGTLTLKSAAGLALDVQYKAEQLLERINAYLGYRAIAKIKVLPGSTVHSTKEPPPPEATPAPANLHGIADPDLKTALARMNAGLLRDKSRSPQGT